MSDRLQDQEGSWLGVRVQGTTISSLRQWVLTHPMTTLYLGLGEMADPALLKDAGVGKLLAFKAQGDLVDPEWKNNCAAHETPEVVPDENAQLRAQAAQFGLDLDGPAPARPRKDAGGAEGPLEASPKKKRSKKQQVRDMLQRAKWNCSATPLDPKYRKPIKIRLKRKRQSSSSSGSSSGDCSSESSREGSSHLQRVAKQLPGYLARCSAKEANSLLAQEHGEATQTYAIFQKYYRQVILRKGGSKPLLREVATLTLAMDWLVQGRILQVADLLSQRLKSLELIQGGTPGDLAAQLELLPKELQGLATQVEAKVAKDEFQQEMKLQNQLKGKGPGKRFPFTPASGKDAKGAGKWGDRKGPKDRKGEQSPQSKIVQVGT